MIILKSLLIFTLNEAYTSSLRNLVFEDSIQMLDRAATKVIIEMARRIEKHIKYKNENKLKLKVDTKDEYVADNLFILFKEGNIRDISVRGSKSFINNSHSIYHLEFSWQPRKSFDTAEEIIEEIEEKLRNKIKGFKEFNKHEDITKIEPNNKIKNFEKQVLSLYKWGVSIFEKSSQNLCTEFLFAHNYEKINGDYIDQEDNNEKKLEVKFEENSEWILQKLPKTISGFLLLRFSGLYSKIKILTDIYYPEIIDNTGIYTRIWYDQKKGIKIIMPMEYRKSDEELPGFDSLKKYNYDENVGFNEFFRKVENRLNGLNEFQNPLKNITKFFFNEYQNRELKNVGKKEIEDFNDAKFSSISGNKKAQSAKFIEARVKALKEKRELVFINAYNEVIGENGNEESSTDVTENPQDSIERYMEDS